MRLLGSLLLSLGALTLVGCGKGSIQSPDFTSTLESISVTPTTASLNEGETQAFTAKGNYTTPPGSDTPTIPRDIDGVTWSSSNANVVSIDSATGVATGVGNGDVTITAKKGDKTGTATVHAFAATLQSLEVRPPTATQPAGRPQQYRAFGTFDTPPGSPTATETHEITTQVTWSVANAGSESDPAPVATIDANSGVATGLRAGSAVVTAAKNSVSGTADFVVTPPILDHLMVTPDNPSVPLGTTVTFTAVGVLTNGATQNLPSDWASSDTSVATVAPATNSATTQATTLAQGTSTITATYHAGQPDQLTDTSIVTVTPAALQTFARVEPPLGRVTIGRQVEFQAIGMYSDGTEQQIPDSAVTWSIANAPGGPGTPVASIDANGVADGLQIGVAVVTATLNDPSSVTNSPTQTAQLTVTGRVCTTPLLSSDGATATGEVSLTCAGCTVANPINVIDSNPDNFATISVPLALLGANAGLRVDALAGNGSYTVPFAAGNNAGFVVSKPAGTLVTAELFSQIQVSTLLGGVEKEKTGNINPLRVDLLGQQVVNGDVFDTALVSIATSVPYDSIRMTFNSGTATALDSVLVGQACGTLDLPEPAAVLVRVERLVPASPTVLAGATVGMVAIGTYTDADGNNPVEGPIADADLIWSSGDEAVATVDANGVVTGVAPGAAVITATLRNNVTTSGQGRSAQAGVTVLPSACQTAFLASEGATAVGSTDGLCLLCSVTNVPNVIDDSVNTAARIGVNLALLTGSASITVTQDPTAAPQPSGQTTGFLIGRPTGTVALAEVLSAIQVSVLREGAVVFSSGPQIPLRLDLLGQQVVAMDDFGLVTVTPTVPYDAIRLTFNIGLLSVGLQNEVANVNAYQACAAATVLPSAKKSMIPYRLH